MNGEGWWFIRSGIRFPFNNIGPEHICLDDIIHHLSQINRWCGGTNVPFSVLEHSLYCDNLFCTEIVAGRLQQITTRKRTLILLHDAHETYTTDFPTELKTSIPALAEFQARIDVAIWKYFGLEEPTFEERATMTRIDRLARLGEAEVLMPYLVYKELIRGKAPPVLLPVPCSPDVARRAFRTRIIGLLDKEK